MVIKEDQLLWFTNLIKSAILNESNYQLANELHKPIIKKFKKRKVYSSFRDNIWGVNLAVAQSLSNYVQLICLVNMHVLFP